VESAVSAPPTVPDAGAPPPAAPPRAPWYRRRTVLFAIGVAVALVAAGATVYVLERPKAANPPTGPLSFSQASAVAESAASRYSSGDWEPIAGIAALTSAPVLIPLGLLGTNASNAAATANCTLTWVGTPTNLTVPAYTGAVGAGLSPDWGLVLANGGSGLLIVTVIDGSARPIVALGGDCATFGVLLGSLAGAVDSPAVAASAQAHGGASFLTEHPGALVEMAVLGGFPLLGSPAEWIINYTSCSLFASGGTSATLGFTFNADTGAMLAEKNATGNCTSPTTLPSGLTLTTSSASIGPDPAAAVSGLPARPSAPTRS
jgi:hypothetical protein